MNRKVLCVDDDTNILAAYRRQLRKQFEITTAEGGTKALETLKNEGPFAAVVADMRMPEMDGVELLTTCKQKYPDMVRVMLTGNADMQTAIKAMNEGAAFRFLCKPCPPEQLAQTLDAALEQYQLVVAEKQLLEDTLTSTVRVLGDLLSLANPIAFSRATRSRKIMMKMAKKLGETNTWEYQVATLLSQIGCLTLPAIVLEKLYQGKPLTPQETELVDDHPKIGAKLIANIPRLGKVSEIVRFQDTPTDDKGIPLDGTRKEPIPRGARVLHLVLDYDMLLRSGKNAYEAFAEIKRSAAWYDPLSLSALEEIITEEIGYVVEEVHLEGLKPGMVMEEDILTKDGTILKVTKGQEITESLMQWLQNIPEDMRLKDTYRVRMLDQKKAH